MIKKTKVGRVVSTKMDKSVVITVETPHRHPLYRKVLRTNKRYKAHDETNQCRLTDMVKIEETRPLSKEKRWRVIEIMVRGEALEYTPKQVTDDARVIPEKVVAEAQPAVPEVAVVAETLPAPEPEPEPEPEAEVEVEATAEVEPEPEPEPEAEAEPELEPEPEPEPEAEVEVEATAEVEPEPEPEPEAEAEPEPEPEPEPKAEPEPEAEKE